MGLNDQQRQEHESLVNEHIDDVELGSVAYNFLHNSAIGRYLVQAAIETKESAFLEFQDIDPKDATAILECQKRAMAPSLVLAYLADAITRGNDASEIIASELEGLNDE